MRVCLLRSCLRENEEGQCGHLNGRDSVGGVDPGKDPGEGGFDGDGGERKGEGEGEGESGADGIHVNVV